MAVHQYRAPHCSDWYDGEPDHHDGHGPYEVRTLYTAPPATEALLDQALEALQGSLHRLAPYGEQDWLDVKAAIAAIKKHKGIPGNRQETTIRR